MTADDSIFDSASMDDEDEYDTEILDDEVEE